jgi:hypothetical protein
MVRTLVIISDFGSHLSSKFKRINFAVLEVHDSTRLDMWRVRNKVEVALQGCFLCGRSAVIGGRIPHIK